MLLLTGEIITYTDYNKKTKLLQEQNEVFRQICGQK